MGLGLGDSLEVVQGVAPAPPRNPGRLSQASGRRGTYARGGRRSGGDKLYRAMIRTRDHDPDAEPGREPISPGAEPGAWWWQDGAGEGAG